jgi:hypothetical protein
VVDDRMPAELITFDATNWAGSRTAGCECGSTCTVPIMCERAAWRLARIHWLKVHGRPVLAEFVDHTADLAELRHQLKGNR